MNNFILNIEVRGQREEGGEDIIEVIFKHFKSHFCIKARRLRMNRIHNVREIVLIFVNLLVKRGLAFPSQF